MIEGHILDEDGDSGTVIIAAESLSCQYEVLMASLERKQLSSLILLSVLITAFIGTMTMHSIGVSEIGEFTVIAEFLPSVLLIILFAAFAMVRHVLSLHELVAEARSAYHRLRQAHRFAVIAEANGGVVP